MDQACISMVQHTICYHFLDKSILWEALQMDGSGTTRIGVRCFPRGNKYLAIHGDNTIQQVLGDDWYASGDTKGERWLSALSSVNE
jgi:hypothetical protein